MVRESRKQNEVSVEELVQGNSWATTPYVPDNRLDPEYPF
jgi:hypothetical protein